MNDSFKKISVILTEGKIEGYVIKDDYKRFYELDKLQLYREKHLDSQSCYLNPKYIVAVSEEKEELSLAQQLDLIAQDILL